MKILVIGSGGREHAIAWRLAREGHDVFGAPGNPGIAEVGRLLPASDYAAAATGMDLTVVGAEAPLVAGIVDDFRARGLRIFGPDRAGAQLEASKIHSKDFMSRAGIPTARFQRVETSDAAVAALSNFTFPVVVKADGLASGKGVIIAQNRDEAISAAETLGPRLVIEEYLHGEEVSFIVMSDGSAIVPFAAAQDHKRIGDDDTGPNTGGMGAYCDGRILTATESGFVMDKIVEPTIRATAFTGFLFVGLMMTAEGPKVLEFNVRLGDPEAQALLHRMDRSASFADLLMRGATSSLRGARIGWNPDPSVCVVMAASGYPGQVRTGDPIGGIEHCGATVFQAGTRIGAKGLETAGGRVLGVASSGPDLSTAIANTYSAVEKIHFDGMQYRRDIGKKGLKRWPAGTI